MGDFERDDYNPAQDDIPRHPEDGVEGDGKGAEGSESFMSGEQGAPRPSRGREGDSGAHTQHAFCDISRKPTGPGEESITVRYSCSQPVRASVKLVLPRVEEGEAELRDILEVLDDMRHKLVFFGSSLSVYWNRPTRPKLRSRPWPIFNLFGTRVPLWPTVSDDFFSGGREDGEPQDRVIDAEYEEVDR